MQTSERLTVDRAAKIAALRPATRGRAASHSARVRRFSHRID